MAGVPRPWRFILILAVLVSGGTAVALVGRIPQDLAYHQFADQRAWFGVSNFLNVVTNLPFLVFGGIGAAAVHRDRGGGVLPALKPAYLVFFLASLLIAAGSGYYHLKPANQSLVWDRLPMAVAFMAFLSLIVGEHLDPLLGRRLLLPLTCVGLLSVGWWWLTESRGQGDLRPYLLVQFLPLLLIPLIVALFPSRLDGVRLLWGVLAVYGLAKGFELLDGAILRVAGVSGHSFKHLAAASGVLLMVIAVRRRRPVCDGSGRKELKS